MRLQDTAFGEPTIAVDTHIFRVCKGIAPGKTPRKVDDALLRSVPDEFKRGAHHWLILHGRYVCTACRPRCGQCVIEDLYEFEDRTRRERKREFTGSPLEARQSPPRTGKGIVHGSICLASPMASSMSGFGDGITRLGTCLWWGKFSSSGKCGVQS